MTEKRIVRADDVITRRIEDEIVIIKDDGLSLHVLNKTAAHIWDMCTGDYGQGAIAASLRERFDVTLEEATADVHDTIAKLEELGILTQEEEHPVNEQGSG